MGNTGFEDEQCTSTYESHEETSSEIFLLAIICLLTPFVLKSVFYMKKTDATLTDEFVDMIPTDEVLEQMTDIQQLDLFVRFTNSFQVWCRNHRRLGSMYDGGKEVCVDRNIVPKAPCLVYSVGSNNRFDFERYSIRFFGCETHTFDHTMAIVPGNEIKAPAGCSVHFMGLSHIDQPASNLYTLRSLRDQLNHTERIIDVLKMDIEGEEWYVINQMIETGALQYVRQLVMELHFYPYTDKSENVRRLAAMRNLYEAGFRAFSRERNLCDGCVIFEEELRYYLSTHVEISYLNLKYV